MYIHANKGKYYCNNNTYFNKLEAILESNKTGKSIHWDFYDDLFSKYNWSIPPTSNIDQLYLERAKQLRDQYDYLVLFYSSGVDSGYILKTFIDNNIKLDEIYLFGAFEAEKKQFKKLGANTNAGYYTREIEYIAKPTIKEILKKQKIKISMYDWEKDILNAIQDPDWFWQAGCRFGPDMSVRNNFHKYFHNHSEMVHKGKQVGFVYGIDKPRLFRDDNSIYFSFLDLMLTSATNNKNDILGETWENDEFFYWNPNFPEIPIKQAHMVVNYLKTTNQINSITHINQNGNMRIPDFYNLCNRIIYPKWYGNLWQIKKPPVIGISTWLFDSKSDSLTQWKNSLWELERQLGSKWFNNNTVIDGLKGHISKLYKICDI